MDKEKPAFLNELKKRPTDKPLTLGELSSLRELGYKYLKEDTNALDLLIQYCKHPKFQVRMCEKAFLMSTISPLMQVDNTHEIIKYGAWSLACLSENAETHKKIINASALPTLSLLILKQIHYEITKYCIVTISNLAQDAENYDLLISLECREYIILKQIDQADNEVQYYILRFLLGLCRNSGDKVPNIPKFLIMTHYLEPLLRCVVSADEKVAHTTLELLRCLITSDKNQEKLMSFNITGKLYHLYHSFKSGGKESYDIMNSIANIFRALLKYSVNQTRLAKERYIKLLIDFLGHNHFELALSSSICLSHMSESIESHDKLVEFGVLDIMIAILKETKHAKLYRQAARFVANISWNTKYQQILLDKEVIEFLLGSLGTADKWTLSHSVTAISNLSCMQNFHETTKHKNIKYLIHVMDSEMGVEDKVLEAAAMALANFSADFYYHEHFLKEPEITMLLKILHEGKEGRIIEHVLALITNLCTNPANAQKLHQKHLGDLLVKNLDVGKNHLLGFIAKSLSGLSVLPEVKSFIMDKNLINYMINTIYIVDPHVQQQILLSLLTLLSTSEICHPSFLEEQGLAVLEHFLHKNDQFFVYVACKMLSILSRNKENVGQLLQTDIINSVFKCGFLKNYIILKEAIRFFTHSLINLKCQTSLPLVDLICKLVLEALNFFIDKETIDLALVSLSMISQFDSTLREIAKHTDIFELLSEKSIEEILPHAEFLILLIMNLSMIPENDHMIVKFKFIFMFNEMIDDLNETCHSYMLSTLIQVFKHEFTEEIFSQKAHQIIIRLLQRNYSHFKSDIIKLINTILESSINYPNELLEVIHHLSSSEDNEEIDDEMMIIQTNVLAKFSFNYESLKYFKKSDIVKFICNILSNHDIDRVITLNCIIILSNISQDPEILDQILQNNISDVLKISGMKLPFNLKKPFIRILTFLTMSSKFDPKLIPNSAVSLLFDTVRNFRDDNDGILMPSIICLINLTTMGYDVIYSFSRRRLIDLLYEIVAEDEMDVNIVSSCLIIISNMMITRDVYDDNKRIIDNIISLADELLPAASSTHPLILSNLLKLIHNLVIIDTSILAPELSSSIVAKAIQIFTEISDSSTKSVILSIVNFMIHKNDTHTIIMQNPKFLDMILSIAFEEKSSFAVYELRIGALSLLVVISQNKEGIEFVKKNLNYIEFMDNLIEIYNDSSSDQPKECMLLILANLCHEKSLIKSLLNKPDHFNFLYNTFVTIFSYKNDSMLANTFKLAINLSAEPTINNFLAKEKLLKILNQLFFQTGIPKNIKDLIQIFLSNLSFNQANHPDMIKNGCIAVFEHYDPSNFKKELDKYALTSLVNLALNSKNFHLLENEINLINSLSLIDEFDKPIQVKLLNAAIEYITEEDKKGAKNSITESRKSLTVDIFATINSMIETNSLFLIKYSTEMLQRMARTAVCLAAEYDSQSLFQNLSHLILNLERIDIKYYNLNTLCLVSKTPSFFENALHIDHSLKLLFDHCQRVFKTIKEKKDDSKQIDLQYDLIFFLKLLSNCAIFGKRNKNSQIFLINKDLEDFLFNVMVYANKNSIILLNNVICCYANLFQSENVAKFGTYGRIFDHLYNHFKKYIKNSKTVETYILGLIQLVLKSKNYLLADFAKGRPGTNDVENPDQSFTSNITRSAKTGSNIRKFPTNETDIDKDSVEFDSRSNINESEYTNSHESPKDKRIVHHSTFMQQGVNQPGIQKTYSLKGNEEYESFKKVKFDKDLQFIFKFIFYIMKKYLPTSSSSKMNTPTQQNSAGELALPQGVGRSLSKKGTSQLNIESQNQLPETSQTELDAFLLISNLAYLEDNHKYILASKLPEHLFNYIKNEANMNHDAYKYAISCALNLANNKGYYKRIKSLDMLAVLSKLYEKNKSCFLEYSTVFLLQMTFIIQWEEFIAIVTLNVKNLDHKSTLYKKNLTKILVLLESTIKIGRLKYKIAKIPQLFDAIFEIIVKGDQSKMESFEEVNHFMSILTLFANSKECISHLTKYGLNNVLRSNLKYLNQIDYLNLKIIKNSLSSENNKSNTAETALHLLVQRLKFLTNLMNLLDATLEIEATLASSTKLKLKVVKDKRVVNDEKSEEMLLTFTNMYDSLDMIVLLKEFTDNNRNLILLSEACLQITNILLKLRSFNFENIMKILTVITKLSRREKISDSEEDTNNQFDYIITTVYHIQEKFYSLYEYQVAEIVIVIIRVFNEKDTNFLKRSSYLSLNKILVKLDFRKLEYSLDEDIKEIMNMLIINNTEFLDVVHKYYATLVIRKIILMYEIPQTSQVFEELLEFSDLMIESVKKFSSSLSQNLAQVEDNRAMNKTKSFPGGSDIKNKRETEKLFIVLILETFIILYKFKDLHFKFVSSEVLKSVVKCSQKISDISQKVEKEQSLSNILYNFTKQDVTYITRVVSLILYEASYFTDTYEDLLSKPVIQFMVKELSNPMKSIHTSIYNALMNVFAIGNSTLVPQVLEEIGAHVENINEAALSSPPENYSTLIPIIAILDFFYDKVVKEIGKEHQFALDELLNIAMILTNAYAEKPNLDIPKSVLGKLIEQAEKHLPIRARLFFVLLRQAKLNKLGQQNDIQRDALLNLILKIIKKDLTSILVKNPDQISDFALIVHEKFMESVLEKGIKYLDDATSLDNIFFWEYFDEEISEEEMLMLDAVLGLYLLMRITRKSFDSQYLTEIYLLLENIARGINNLKTTDVIKDFYKKILKEILSNLSHNELFKKP